MGVICLVVFILGVATCKTYASLVICVFNTDSIFVGGDSLVVSATGETVERSSAAKMFALGQHSVATITGSFGTKLELTESRKEIGSIFLPSVVANLCSNVIHIPLSLRERADYVTKETSNAYVLAWRFRQHFALDAKLTESTRLAFVGYDEDSSSFLGYTSLLERTNAAIVSELFSRRLGETNAYFFFQGEDKFLTSLLRGEVDFKAYRSKELDRAINDIKRGVQVSDARMRALILEMFELHVAHARTKTTDKGHVGGPFLIYKISKDGVRRIGD